MSDDWTDKLVGARMQVDQRFQETIERSQFSSQEWGLIMTAVEFELEHPDDPERAKLVARTEQLSEVMPQLDTIQEQMGSPAQPGTPGGSGGSGILDRLRNLFDGSGDTDSGSTEERLTAAESLVDQYAAELQDYLVERDRWKEIREAASE